MARMLFGLTCLGFCMGLSAPVPGGAEASSEQSAAETVELSTSVYPPDVSGESAYLAFVDGRAGELVALAQEQRDPLRQAEHHLMAANWMLARQTEPFVSRLLLGIAGPDEAGHLLAAVEQAQAQLDAASVGLAGLGSTKPTTQPSEPAAGDADREIATLGSVRDDLASFAEAYAAAWSSGSDDEAIRRVRRAASGLAVLLEDERRGVAQSAMLCQALLYRRAGLAERAARVLDLALQPLSPDAPQSSLYARLLRCRIVAEEGGYAAAYSLLLKLEERCHDWFDAPQEIGEAVRAVLLLRKQVVQDWQASVVEPANQEHNAWCEAVIGRLDEAMLQIEGTTRVMRLGAAVPSLLEADVP